MVIDFLMDNILTRFWVPMKIVSKNAMCFNFEEFSNFYTKHGIQTSYSSSYHTKFNVQVESINKSLMKIIKRIIEENKRAWDSKPKLALWSDQVVVKKAIG